MEKRMRFGFPIVDARLKITSFELVNMYESIFLN